jgi:hypothetical protein
MIKTSDLEEAYGGAPSMQKNQMVAYTPSPACEAPGCFIGSYAPVTPAGQMGPYLVNTYFLQDDRRKEVAGAVKA